VAGCTLQQQLHGKTSERVARYRASNDKVRRYITATQRLLLLLLLMLLEIVRLA